MKSVAWLLPAASSRYGQWNVEQLLSPLTSASTNIFISDLFQISVTGGNHITRLRDSNRHQAVWCQDNATPPAQPELERSSQSPFYNLKLCLRSIKCCKGSHTCSQSQYQPTQFTNQIWCGLLTTAVLPCLLPTPPTDIQSDEPHWQHFCENIKRYFEKIFKSPAAAAGSAPRPAVTMPQLPILLRHDWPRAPVSSSATICRAALKSIRFHFFLISLKPISLFWDSPSILWGSQL